MIETIIEFIFNPYLLVNIGWMIILAGMGGEKMKKDTTWSIKHEGHLNRNNIIFKDPKFKDMVDRIKDAVPRPIKQTVTKSK